MLFWIALYLLWVVVFRGYSFTLSKTMTVEFCYLIFIAADYYTINNFLVPRFLLKKKYIFFGSAAVLIIALSAWLRALAAVQMNLYFFHAVPVPGFGALYINSVMNILFWVLLFTIGKMFIDKARAQQQLDLLEKEKLKNEMDYLKAQINPHALFNSLNTIYGHIDKSNSEARDILLQFSELLRYQLYDCGAQKVSLEKEIDYIKNFVAFQRLRKPGNLMIDFDPGPVKAGLDIAPLLLIVLIENAFKFVSNFADGENRISVKIETKENVLYGSFLNTTEEEQTPVNHNDRGIGLVNLKRRLELLYPNKHRLITNRTTGIYKTDLIIELA